MKRVLSIGQCSPDQAALERLIRAHFAPVEIVSEDFQQAALEALRGGRFDLVLVNRIFDADGSDGIELIQTVKAEAGLQAVPVMLVSNYPQYQQQAIAAGAEPGFGKLEYGRRETVEKLGRFLG